ncbi:hypothetical protein NST50_11995 [Paenibacillus sp. FSL E2-0202]|uniref:hypothetical protein n=1 Tax=Paenibacillus TaxID=44249 RepID=UPI00096DB8CA|nr:hypothetical protein [Paenibacillus odorifer]OME06866.1 hypothetical protein BSK64_09145 [Paenibacillus odorifer]
MDRKKSKRSRGFPYACSFFDSKAQSFSPRGLFLQMISDNVQPRVAMPTQRHKSSAYVGDYLRNLASQIVTDRIAAIFAALHDRYGPYCSYFCCTDDRYGPYCIFAALYDRYELYCIFAALHDRYGPYCSYFGIMVVLARVSDCMVLISLKSRIIGVHLGE